jgi:type II secretory pathway pseudopilin PulG
VILGLLATVVVASTGGFTAQAEATSCSADAHTLYTSTEAYFAQRSTATIPATGAGLDRYELTLAIEGFLRAPSDYYDLDQHGDLVQVTGSVCTA